MALTKANASVINIDDVSTELEDSTSGIGLAVTNIEATIDAYGTGVNYNTGNNDGDLYLQGGTILSIGFDGNNEFVIRDGATDNAFKVKKNGANDYEVSVRKSSTWNLVLDAADIGDSVQKQITVSEDLPLPSNGVDGDIWIQI